MADRTLLDDMLSRVNDLKRESLDNRFRKPTLHVPARLWSSAPDDLKALWRAQAEIVQNPYSQEGD